MTELQQGGPSPEAPDAEAIVAGSDHAIVGNDPDGTIVTWNAGAERLFGYTVQEAVGCNIRFLVPEERLGELATIRERVEQGLRVPQFDTVGLHRNGRRVEIAISFAPVCNPSGGVIGSSAIAHSIAPRLAAQRQRDLAVQDLRLQTNKLEQAVADLEAARAELATLYDGSPDMLVSSDVETARVVRCNRRLVERTGRSREALLGTQIVDLFHPDSRDGARAAFARFAKAGELKNVRLALLAEDGGRIEVLIDAVAERDAGGAIVGSRSALREVGELERTRELFELAVEAAPAGMLVVDTAGTIVLANKNALEMFGYSRSELVGDKIEKLVPSEVRPHHPQLRGGFAAAPTARKLGSERSLLGVRKGGSTFPVELGLNPVQSGSELLVLAAVVDRTLLVDHQREREAQARALERSKAELQHFVYAASHDLQEPLRMVTNYTSLLQKRYAGQLDEKGDRFIGYAIDGATRMRQMLGDLLELSRAGALEWPHAPVALDEALADARALLRPQMGSAVIEASSLPHVPGNREDLLRLFQNLLSNALKYRGTDTPRIQIGAVRVGSHWEITVADNGIGFDPSHAERIFEPFQRLHGRSAYEGNGMGLAIVSKIVDRHGGRVWVEAEPDKGATFHFTLPGLNDETD